jgi:hypothetical protein
MKFIYANLGRGNAANVERSWESLADAANDADVDAAVVVEVDEGDKGYSDHGFARRFFKGWRLRFMRRMVVILVNAKHKVAGATVTDAPNSAVKRWSPFRYVVELVIPTKRGPDVCVIGVHYAAGYKNGTRPSWARPLLAASWLATRAVHRARVRAANKRGQHSVTLMDCNDHSFDVKFLHPDAVTLFGPGGSDWGVAVPAPGYHVAWDSDSPVRTYVERFHQGHKITVNFKRDAGQ